MSLVPAMGSVVQNQPVQHGPPFRADKMDAHLFGKGGEVGVAGHKKLIARAPVLVREFHRAQAAENAQAQEKVLHLPGHALGGRGVEEAAARLVDVPIPLPHAADEQADLAVGQLEGGGGDLFGVGGFAQMSNSWPKS